MNDANPPRPFGWTPPPRKPDDAEQPVAPAFPPTMPPPTGAPFFPPSPGPGQPPPTAGYPPAQQQPGPSYPPQPPYQPAQPFPPQPPYPPGPINQPQAPYQPERPRQPQQYPAGQVPYQPTEAFRPPPPQQPPYEETPTQAFSFDPKPAQAYPFDSSFPGATDLHGGHHVGLPELRDEGPRPHAPASAIDALFGESQFREYEAGLIPSDALSTSAPLREREPREPMGRPQKVLLWVAGGLVAALAFVGLFMLGTKLGALIPPAVPEVEASGPPTLVEAQPPPVGPLAPGTYAWDELLGTECIDPFVSAWQEEYVVVDCATPHSAQMVAHGYFADESYAPYPGEAELQSRINLLCTSPKTVDYSIASRVSDMQVAASYAVSADDWDAGKRDYYCFVTRSSSEALNKSIAPAVVPSDSLVPTVPSNEP